MLAGRYRVTGRLGRGGMGVVWRAVDQVLGREVAIKELRTYSDVGCSELQALHTRLQREARAAARVRHPGVIAVHDVAEHEGRPVIVMELVDGPSLDDVLRECGTLDPRDAARVGAKVLDALAAAHRVGVLHRDVKPGNVLLEKCGAGRQGQLGEGRVVLTDFGIAAIEDPDDGHNTRLTHSGELVGSLDYLAPERARGDKPGPASDVWALGAMLYAAVEGSAPFRRTSTWSTLNAIVVEPLPEPRRAGPLGPALAELMEKDPAQRADAARAAALLQAVASGAPLPPADLTVRLGHGAEAPFAAAPPAAPAVAHPSAASADPHPTAAAAEPAPLPGAADGVAAGVAAGPVRSAEPDASDLPGGPRHGRDTARRATGTRTSRTGAGRMSPNRRNAAVAAAVAAVVLAGVGGIYVALPHGRGQAAVQSQPDAEGSAQPPVPAGEPQADDGADRPGSPPDGGGSVPAGSPAQREGGTAHRQPAEGSEPHRPAAEPTAADPGRDSADSPACSGIGGGKYTCVTWAQATSYDADHNTKGVLNAGRNYFYCQTRTAARETSGKWSNVWWAKTDDDSGNADVYISDVYIRGGENDRPVPGLPLC